MNIIYSFYVGAFLFALGMGTHFSFGIGLITLGVIILITEATRGFISYMRKDRGKVVFTGFNNHERWTEE